MCRRTAQGIAIVVALVLVAPALGATKRDPVVGDWRIETEFDGRKMVSVVSLSKSKDGDLSGQWISLWGVTELSNVRFEGDQLSFTRTRRFRDRESTWNFAGAVAKTKLSGTVSSERGESTVTGQRIRGMRKPVGVWETTVHVDERTYRAKLAIEARKKGQLAASWQSDWGEHEITDVRFKKGKLSFKRRSKVEDRQWESTFEGTIKGHALSGEFTREGRRVPVEGKRVGAALVGIWDLKITSDSGNRSQRLRVYPGLTGMYGPLDVERIKLEDNRVSFETAAEFGDQRFGVTFTGTLDGGTLRGEVTSPRGTRAVEGVRRPQRAVRKPDVVFVPTPEEVVDKMLELAQVKKGDLLYDLGCGDGRIVVTAAKTYGCRAVGYDISPKRVRESRENVEQNDVGDLVSIEQKDIFTLDLSDANVVTLYLLPSLNVKLIPQLEKLKPGCRIVSHDFDMEGVIPDEVVTVTTDDSYEQHTIYLWTTPLNKETAQ
jgi:hypothetical protein